ncbi:hypothetical protein ACQEVC_26335 [Plantactinospora sp. CA-294935]|uniref:hypothetical protein n=1 Tax=Plantactinospora sp. CA-294935 TaxID=3240012 RepID=UPI003D938607
MTKSDDRIARWSIRHPWWATNVWLAFVATTVVLGDMTEATQAELSEYGVGESAWAEEPQEAAGLERPGVESVLVTPGGPEGTAAIQDRAVRLAPLAEVGEPVLSPTGVLEPVTAMAFTQRRS